MAIAYQASDHELLEKRGFSVSSTGHESHNVQLQRFGGDLHVENSSSRFNDAVEGDTSINGNLCTLVRRETGKE